MPGAKDAHRLGESEARVHICYNGMAAVTLLHQVWQLLDLTCRLGYAAVQLCHSWKYPTALYALNGQQSIGVMVEAQNRTDIGPAAQEISTGLWIGK